MMTDRIKSAFSDVHASQAVKERTLEKIAEKRRGRKKSRIATGLRIAAAGAACFAAFAVGFTYGTQTGYLSLDINPSISLGVNDYGRVIRTAAYGAESEEILDSVSVKNKSYGEALQILLDSEAMQSYLKENGQLWIAVQANNPETEARMEQDAQSAAASALEQDHPGYQITARTVTAQVRQTAESEGVSAGKYAAIEELQAVDPNATVEEYKESTIGEICEQTKTHHETAQVTPTPEVTLAPPLETQAAAAPVTPEPAVPTPAPATPAPTPAPTAASRGHHGHGHGGGHH